AVRRDARTLTALDPQDRPARYWLGESLFRAGERAAALVALEPLAPATWDGGAAPTARAPAAGSDNALPEETLADLGFLIGSLRHSVGRPEESIAPLRMYLRLRPADRMARTILADALEKTGRAREAEVERRSLGADAA